MVTKKTAESQTPNVGAAPPERNGNVDRTKVHRAIIARRLGGGAPATPEAYARALQQWQRLPGALASVPAAIPTDPLATSAHSTAIAETPESVPPLEGVPS